MTTLQDRPAAPAEPKVEAPPKVLHTLKIKGALKKNLTWYTEVPATVNAARQAFVEATSQGYAAFDTSTPEGEQIREFDPEAQDIMMFAPIAGG